MSLRGIIFFFFLMLFSLKGLTQSDSRGYIVKVGDIAPDFQIKLTDNSTFRLSDHRGKLVMLQFTASWCGVCRREMPFIESQIWKPNQQKNFVLVAIDLDEPLEAVLKFGEQTGITYPMALDEGGTVFAKYAEEKAGVTRNVLIDEQGQIIFLTRLFNEEEFQLLVNKINSCLGK